MASRSLLRVSLLTVALAFGAAYALACSDSGGSDASSPNDGDGGYGSLPDAAVGPSDGQSAATTMRVAHLAPDLGPVDFCYRTTKASSFQGPVLGGGREGIKGGDAGSDADADAGRGEASEDGEGDVDGDASGVADAGAPSVSYRRVSRYLTLIASGPLTVALVAPGATSCATPLFTADVTLDPGKLATVAIVGRTAGDGGDAQLALVAFIDDRTTAPGQSRVRMIHAALGTAAKPLPAGALAVRASSSQTVIVAERVEPKKAASASAAVPVDSLGYATIAPVPSPAQLAVGVAEGSTASDASASSQSWVSQPFELGMRGGSLHTGFVLTGGADQSFEVLWCTDTTTSGNDTTCTLVR